MSKHTPGPWKYGSKLTFSENHRGFSVWQIHHGWALASVQPADADGNEGEANARLIAAAPDLLEALKRVALILGSQHAALEVIDAAIAKAEGK